MQEAEGLPAHLQGLEEGGRAAGRQAGLPPGGGPGGAGQEEGAGGQEGIQGGAGLDIFTPQNEVLGCRTEG